MAHIRHNVPDTAEEIQPLLIDMPMPQVVLRTVDGEAFDVNEAIRKKPTILLFYRGGW